MKHVPARSLSCALSLALVLTVALTPDHGLAQATKGCDAEPTDMMLTYKDPTIVCAIDAVADVDLFRFNASVGDSVRIVLTETSSIFLGPCFEVRDPNNNVIVPQQCGATNTVAEFDATTPGRHTLIVSDAGNDDTGGYNLSLSCLFGPCSPSPPGVQVVVTGCNPCKIGQFAELHLHVTNPGAARTVEVKAGSHFPDGVTNFVFLGRYVEMQIPAGESDILIPGLTLPAGLPFGVYTIEAALLEPDFGTTLSRHSVTATLNP